MIKCKMIPLIKVINHNKPLQELFGSHRENKITKQDFTETRILLESSSTQKK